MKILDLDKLRQWLNILTAPLMWALSSIPQISNYGRTAKEFSEVNDSLLVPYGIAFSIWLPIFIGCIGYSIVQGFKVNRKRKIYRKIGWYTGIGFLGVCMWSIFSAWGSPRVSLLGTALIFIPTVYCLTKSMIILSDNSTSLDTSEKFWVFIPVSLIAGWTSLAIFLNWAPIVSIAFGTSLYDIATNIFVLVLALAWAANITYKSYGNLAFSFAILWGLSWLIVDFTNSNNLNTSLSYTTILGIFLIIFITYASSSSTKKIEEKETKNYKINHSISSR